MWDYRIECWCGAIDANRRFLRGAVGFALNCQVRGHLKTNIEQRDTSSA
jgi:hypothetical protein